LSNNKKSLLAKLKISILFNQTNRRKDKCNLGAFNQIFEPSKKTKLPHKKLSFSLKNDIYEKFLNKFLVLKLIIFQNIFLLKFFKKKKFPSFIYLVISKSEAIIGENKLKFFITCLLNIVK